MKANEYEVMEDILELAIVANKKLGEFSHQDFIDRIENYNLFINTYTDCELYYDTEWTEYGYKITYLNLSNNDSTIYVWVEEEEKNY